MHARDIISHSFQASIPLIIILFTSYYRRDNFVIKINSPDTSIHYVKVNIEI